MAAANTAFDEERTLVTAALRDGDAQARATLLASPTTAPALQELLAQDSTGEAALEQALLIEDQTQQAATQQAQAIGDDVTAALKLSFANSITKIYFYALWLVAAALLLVALALPELPLRKTNRPEAAVPVFE